MDKKSKDDFGEFYLPICTFIKKRMAELRITQKEMAYILGTNTGSFWQKLNYSAGKFNILELYRIANELVMTLDSLIAQALSESELGENPKISQSDDCETAEIPQ